MNFTKLPGAGENHGHCLSLLNKLILLSLSNTLTSLFTGPDKANIVSGI